MPATKQHFMLPEPDPSNKPRPVLKRMNESAQTSEVTRLIREFREEVDKATEAGEDAVRKTRLAARTARRKDSVQNLKAVSHPPPPKEEEED